MVVDRIIFVLSPNRTYWHYWPVVARVWRDCFRVRPTVIFSGTEADYEAFCRQSPAGLGDLVHVSVPGVLRTPSRDWVCTCGFFYGPTIFPHDMCMTSGIDQVPLNGEFLQRLAAVSEDCYVVGLSDGYKESSRFPSSHHVATGDKFAQIYERYLAGGWEAFVHRVAGTVSRFPRLPQDWWGLEEEWSSEVLKQRLKDVGDVTLFMGFEDFRSRRLTRGDLRDKNIDWEGIEAGRYTEWHLPRDPQACPPEQLERLYRAVAKRLQPCE